MQKKGTVFSGFSIGYNGEIKYTSRAMNLADATFNLTKELKDDNPEMNEPEQLLVRGLLQTWITKDKMDTEQPFLVSTIVNYAKQFSEQCEEETEERREEERQKVEEGLKAEEEEVEEVSDNFIYKQYPEPESYFTLGWRAVKGMSNFMFNNWWHSEKEVQEEARNDTRDPVTLE